MDELKQLREEIDQVDETLIRTLAMRFRITGKVGRLKKSQKLSLVDPQREAEQEKRILELAEEVGLRGDIALSVLRLIIERVLEDHKKA